MERGVSLPSSNPLGGSNFRESLPIGIKSYPALALLRPGSGYGLIFNLVFDGAVNANATTFAIK
jgi:hypothetical protein